MRQTDPKEAEGRVVIAHLGNGASMTAVRHGKSVDATMGFTPAGGLDTLIFTTGIGENSPPTRWRICEGMEFLGIYLPPDANCLLSVVDHCLRSTNYVNVIVSDKQLHLQYLTGGDAIRHCSKGIGIWDWAGNDQGDEPDVVMACAGDIPTMEALAATALLRENFPEVKVRFINVVDLFKLEPQTEHLHGLSDWDFDRLFTIDKPIIFNFHRYPWLIHKLAYRRTNHPNLHVRGYKERGNINTPLELPWRTKLIVSIWRWMSSTGFPSSKSSGLPSRSG